MQIGKEKYYKRFKVIFGPQEADEWFDKFGHCRCLKMRARTDLKPWGTREAIMEEKIDLPKKSS